jgi:O-antigen/teichoic acid export membrane protein
MSLNVEAGRSAVWMLVGGMIQTAIRVGASMILARNLDPVDFGIFGIAILVYGLFELLSATGMTSGIIVKEKPDFLDLSTCFWCIMGIRSALFCIIVMLAPIIAILLQTPDLSLLIRVLSVLIIISGAGALSQALLTKKLFFKKIVIIRIFGVLIESSVAVFVVLTTTQNYWALVTGMISGIFFMNFYYVISSQWLPRFTFSTDRVSYLMRFGLNTMGSSFVAYLRNNIDYLIVAKLLGAVKLGYYEFAYRIPNMINEKVSGPIGSVIFPSLAKLQDSNERLLNGHIKATSYLSWLFFPAFAGLAILSQELVLFLWGGKWLEVVMPLKILCVGATIQSITGHTRYVYFCKNRPDLPFKFDLLGLCMTICFVSLLGYYHGLVGIATGMAISQFIMVTSSLYALKILESSILVFFKAILKPFLAATIMMILVFFLKKYLTHSEIGLLPYLLLTIVWGILTYVAFIYLCFRKDFKEIQILMKKIIIKQNS